MKVQRHLVQELANAMESSGEKEYANYKRNQRSGDLVPFSRFILVSEKWTIQLHEINTPGPRVRGTPSLAHCPPLASGDIGAGGVISRAGGD